MGSNPRPPQYPELTVSSNVLGPYLNDSFLGEEHDLYRFNLRKELDTHGLSHEKESNVMGSI